MKKYVCKYCGKEFMKKNKSLYCSVGCMMASRKKYADENSTLCWSCKNACGRCEWSAFFIPVRGWNAKETFIKNQHKGTEYKSYHVYECPKYIPDRGRA